MNNLILIQAWIHIIEMRSFAVFCYIPNIIGYVRALLIVIGWFFFEDIRVFLPLYTLSAVLDGIDGCTARALGQTSPFGAWLDVLVDNIGRTVLWTRLFDWGVFIVCLEWTVFVCTHSLGPQWKQDFEAAPSWVKGVMDKGFYNPAGVFVIAGIHGLPPYLYFFTHLPPWNFLEHVHFLLIVPIVILVAGRLYCLAVELWCIKTHIVHLIGHEEDRKLNSLTKDLYHSDSAI